TAVSGQICTGAAALSITGSGVLPVNLISFNGTEINNQVILNWRTAGEINNRKFDIQRSKDGSNWMVLGSVKGVGNTVSVVAYHFTDSTPLRGKNFYRLIQYDIDGRIASSGIITVNFSTSSAYTIAGNPGNGIYQVNIQTFKPVTIWLSDFSGKRLQTNLMVPGMHAVDISKYPAGMYLLQINTGTEIFTEKLLKNNR
ncbi:MAG: T9SS type A sorting domain-containing protein, partial [Ferruginibacter sp.]